MTRKDMGPWGRGVCFGLALNKVGGGRGGGVLVGEQAFLMQKFALDLTPMSDQDRVSPYNINTLSTRQVLRKKKKINLGIIS